MRAHVKKDDGRQQVGNNFHFSILRVLIYFVRPMDGPCPLSLQLVGQNHQKRFLSKKNQLLCRISKIYASTPQVDHPAVSSQNVPVPVPVYCRPLMEKEPGMKIWCAAGVNLTGGRTKDGGDIVGASVFYSAPPPEEHKAEEEDEISRLDAELKEGATLGQEASEADQQLSSLVWICTSTHSISKVTVIDANNPADVLESFHVCSSHLLCIASVPGEPICLRLSCDLRFSIPSQKYFVLLFCLTVTS